MSYMQTDRNLDGCVSHAQHSSGQERYGRTVSEPDTCALQCCGAAAWVEMLPHIRLPNDHTQEVTDELMMYRRAATGKGRTSMTTLATAVAIDITRVCSMMVALKDWLGPATRERCGRCLDDKTWCSFKHTQQKQNRLNIGRSAQQQGNHVHQQCS